MTLEHRYDPYFTDRTELNSRDLVHMLVEYHSMCGGRARLWEKANESDIPSVIRLARINALTRALGVPTELYKLVNGELLPTNAANFYQPAVELLKSLFPHEVDERYLVAHQQNCTDRQQTDLELGFGDLFMFRCALSSTMSTCWSKQSRDHFVNHTQAITLEIRNSLEPIIHRLDTMLSYLLDPSEHVVSFVELISKWDWPTADLQKIDKDHWD